MSKNQTVSININESKLMQNLGYAFSNSSTVLSETMQNSRRSGADEVRFFFDEADLEQTLTIIDNGSGIADMQKLLTLAESGWGDDITKTDHPFGMGWFSVIYAATRIQVLSLGQSIDFESKEILDFAEIEVKPIDYNVAGTKMTLSGFKLGNGIESVFSALEREIKRYAEGFPIRVFLNNVEIQRPHALISDNVFNHYHSIGDMSIVGMPGISEKYTPTNHFAVYLQGLPIYRTEVRYASEIVNIVHLDSEIYSARLPDRDKLIDEKENVDAIYQRIQSEWRDYFKKIISAGEGNQVITKWWHTVKLFKLTEIINQVNCLPNALLSVCENYPIVDYYCNNQYESDIHETNPIITREMVESNAVVLVDAISLSTETTAQWMMMYKRDNFYFIHSLPKDHWAKPYVQDWALVKPVIKPLGNIEERVFNGDWYGGNCCFCDTYQLKIGKFSIEIDDVSIGMDDEYEGADFYVPLKDRGGEVVGQCCTFLDEGENVNYEAREREEELFSLFVRFYRELSPADIIQSLMADSSLRRFDGLDGTYSITLKEGTIEVCDQAAA